MIKITNVSKHYGDFKVLTDCTTSVSKGEVLSLIHISEPTRPY